MKLTEIFKSIQGEGLRTGVPTIFLRLSGCNLRCKWCDTKYAYEEGSNVNLDQVISDVEAFGPNLDVCITGGEPLLQKDSVIYLCLKFIAQRRTVVLETNGAKSIEDFSVGALRSVIVSMDVKCPSSGMVKKNLLSNFTHIKDTDQVKFVIADDDDYSYAKNIVRTRASMCKNIIFQPVVGQDHYNMETKLKRLSEKILQDNLTNVRLGFQLHKLIWGDERKR